jgi:hypothetical protein
MITAIYGIGIFLGWGATMLSGCGENNDREIHAPTDSSLKWKFEYPFSDKHSQTKRQIEDLDGDGKKEIISAVTTYDYDYEPYVFVYVINSDGTVELNWPKMLPDALDQTPLIADIDNNGTKEIIYEKDTYQDGKVYIWEKDGTEIGLWEFPGANFRPRAIADLENNFSKKIIGIKEWEDEDYLDHQEIMAYNPDGSIFREYTQAEWPNSLGVHAVGDLDNDGELDFIFSEFNGTENKTYIFAQRLIDGQILQGWPKETNLPYPSYSTEFIVLGDIDGDKTLEMFFVDNLEEVSSKRLIQGLRYDGSNLNGYPVYFEVNLPLDAMALGDVDGDKFKELAVPTLPDEAPDNWPGLMYLFNKNGEVIQGWPQSVWGSTGGAYLADIDGDSDQEIITGEPDGDLFAWHHDGSLVAGYPTWITGGEIALNDIENDGKIDLLGDLILDTEGSFAAWDLGGKYNPNNIKWGTYRHDNYHTGNADFIIDP